MAQKYLKLIQIMHTDKTSSSLHVNQVLDFWAFPAPILPALDLTTDAARKQTVCNTVYNAWYKVPDDSRVFSSNKQAFWTLEPNDLHHSMTLFSKEP